MRGTQAVSGSFEIQPLVGAGLSEGIALPEQFMLPGYEQRLAAFRAVFAEPDAFDLESAAHRPTLEPLTPSALQTGLPEPIAPYKLTLDEDTQDQPDGESARPVDDPLAPVVGGAPILPPAPPPPDDNVAPVFTPNSPVSVSEAASAGTSFVAGAATDADGDTLTFSIAGGNVGNAFAIDASTGVITVANPARLDFETRPAYALTVAVDDGHGHVVEQTYAVTLTDANDAPVIANQAFAVTENSANGTVVGTVVGERSRRRPDPDLCDRTGGSGAWAFQIDAATGQLRVADAAQLDREAVAALTVEVSVTDSATQSETRSRPSPST